MINGLSECESLGRRITRTCGLSNARQKVVNKGVYTTLPMGRKRGHFSLSHIQLIDFKGPRSFYNSQWPQQFFYSVSPLKIFPHCRLYFNVHFNVLSAVSHGYLTTHRRQPISPGLCGMRQMNMEGSLLICR